MDQDEEAIGLTATGVDQRFRPDNELVAVRHASPLIREYSRADEKHDRQAHNKHQVCQDDEQHTEWHDSLPRQFELPEPVELEG